jgi:PAS domain S-box-containing protein
LLTFRQQLLGDGTVIEVNRDVTAERVFGYSAGEAIGQPITIVIPEDRQSEEREILTRIRRGERFDHFETIRRRRDGTLVNVSLTISPSKTSMAKSLAHRRSRGILASKREITS